MLLKFLFAILFASSVFTTNVFFRKKFIISNLKIKYTIYSEEIIHKLSFKREIFWKGEIKDKSTSNMNFPTPGLKYKNVIEKFNDMNTIFEGNENLSLE